LIPPLLGFYAKLFVLHSLSATNISLTIIAVLCSVISCLRYLNLIQISNKKKNHIITLNRPGNPIISKINSSQSYIIAILTIFITLSF
jgi:NADH:ubiquinone oxidoreductase subunit 2 (subunit N)